MVVGNINAKPSSATKTKSDLVGLSMRTSREEYLFHQGGHKGGSDKENVFSSLLFFQVDSDIIMGKPPTRLGTP